MSSDISTDANPPASAPPPPAPRPSASAGPPARVRRRPSWRLILVACAVLLVVAAGVAFLTRGSSRPKTVALGSGASATESNAMVMCGVVGAVLDDPSAQAQPELGRRVQAVLNVGTQSGDRYQEAVAKLGQEGQTGDPAAVLKALKDLQALCQPSQPTG